MWPITLSGRLPIAGLVGRYLTNYLMGRELTSDRIAPLTPSPCGVVVSCGISATFAALSPCLRQIAHALLTRPPLEQYIFESNRNLHLRRMSPLDLHVLGTPPAFVLSQDQTLPFNPSNTLVFKLFGIFAEFLARFSLYRFQGSLALPAVPRRRACIEYQTQTPLSSVFWAFLKKKSRRVKASGRCLIHLDGTFGFSPEIIAPV